MAGWDVFLTEQDKAHQAVVGRKETDRAGFGKNPAVLVIDDYYSVLGLEREPILDSIKSWPGSCGLEGWEAIDKTVELLASARANNIPIVYCHGTEDFPAPWSARASRGGDRLSHLPDEVRMRANEIVEEIAPQAGDLVIKKTAASIFQGTAIVNYLTWEGIDTLITVGETTSGCVRASVVDGAAYRYRMGVVAECCFDRTQASHWINLFDMHSKYADVIDRFEAAKYFEAIAASTKVAAMAAV